MCRPTQHVHIYRLLRLSLRCSSTKKNSIFSALQLLDSPNYLTQCFLLLLFLGLAIYIHYQCSLIRKHDFFPALRRAYVKAVGRSLYMLVASALVLHSYMQLSWVGLLLVSRTIALCMTRAILDSFGVSEVPLRTARVNRDSLEFVYTRTREDGDS
ncbi:hypothetical protein HMI55_003194 [Coelomomyces lativittatus]|nr:hypothetical protein HMI55_003194 [Coelomomyces lativittatus]KAJ1512572.1 hypothetical protein HMI56_003869 [Coelomomyces lativittatus]